jgi:hypothetical protein
MIFTSIINLYQSQLTQLFQNGTQVSLTQVNSEARNTNKTADTRACLLPVLGAGLNLYSRLVRMKKLRSSHIKIQIIFKAQLSSAALKP